MSARRYFLMSWSTQSGGGAAVAYGANDDYFDNDDYKYATYIYLTFAVLI